MKNHVMITYLLTCALSCTSTQPQGASRVLIYNNHSITQTVSSSTTERGCAYNRHRFPGHTKNETASHRVAISPTSAQPASKTFQEHGTIMIDNTHTISQDAVHATIHGLSSDLLMPEQVSSIDNKHAQKSWLAALIPPLIANSSTAKYLLCSLGIGYLALIAKLVHASYATLAKRDSWSSWQSTITIEQMRQHEKQYAQELFAALQTRYINAPVNAHFLSPLVHFINDVNQELIQLNSFITIHNTINKFKLTFMFPKQQDALRIAHEKINRLEYFKSIIINWVGEYRT